MTKKKLLKPDWNLILNEEAVRETQRNGDEHDEGESGAPSKDRRRAGPVPKKDYWLGDERPGADVIKLFYP